MSILLSILLGALGIVGQFLKAFLDKRFVEDANSVLPIAIQAVADIAASQTELTAEEKFQAARDKMLRQLTRDAIVVGNSVINWAVETAYQKYKADGK